MGFDVLIRHMRVIFVLYVAIGRPSGTHRKKLAGWGFSMLIVFTVVCLHV